MLELLQVCKSFGRDLVLDQVSLDVSAHKITVLIGPSGCGKSTLIKIVLGLLAPDQGTITFAGQRLNSLNATSMRRNIGYVVQQGGLFPHLNVLENLGLMARHLGWKTGEICARADELLNLVRLSTELVTRYPSELSGGQRQRIGLARALMLDPPLLLLDEPLGALDPLVRRELQDDLRLIFQDLGKAVLLVTHDLYEAKFFASEIVVMNRGRIVQRGSVNDLVERPADPFVTRFIEAQRKEIV